MKKNGFERACRYFIRTSEQYVLYAAGIGVAMVLYTWVINGSRSFADMIPAIPSTILYMSVFMLFIVGATAGQQWYSVLISMGCRRKNVFLGNLLMDFLYIAECLVLYEVLDRILNPQNRPLSSLLLLAVYLLLEGVSKLICVATIKWGKIANIFLFVIIFLVSITFGMWIGYSGGAEARTWINDLISGRIRLVWQWITAGIGAMVCAAANIVTWRFMQTYEVRT